ncbi:hypothetical protein CNR22_09445 [Sphingobacteriaceae bacterium]|nr:hypothetical protein CNR22_09445 [Sphingobacteriaceae bacterium]
MKNGDFMRKFLKSIVLGCFSLMAAFSYAQAPSNVHYQSLLDLNPSFAGSNGLIRNQSSIRVPASDALTYLDVTNNFDTYLSSIKSGIGLGVNYSTYNSTNRTVSGSLAYAKYFNIKEHLKIIPSVQAEYTSKEIFLGRYQGSVFAVNGSPWIRVEYFALHAGLLVNYKNLYAGLSVFNLNTPDAGFFSTERIPVAKNWHLSYNLNLRDNLHVNFFGQLIQTPGYTLAKGSINILCFKHLIYGVSHERSNSGMNVGFRSDYFIVQGSYQRDLSRLTPDEFNGTWQVLLSFNLRNKEKRQSITDFEKW